MRRRSLVLAISIATIVGLILGHILSSRWSLLTAEPSGYEVYKRALGYTVFIYTKIPSEDLILRGSNAKKKQEMPSGSGFVKKEDGRFYLITANHVVVSSQSNSLQYVQFYGEKRLHLLKKLGWDRLFDLAVLEFVDRGFHPSSWALLGDSRSVKTADRIYILGNPLGLEFLWSEGKVMGSKTYTPADKTGFLAVDATCNPGNSGGPVINQKGEVIGIAEAITGPRPICFVTPVHILKILWPKLKAGGEIKHGMLGIELGNSWDLVPEETKRLGIDKIRATGAVILRIVPGSPAARADFKRGDVLLSFGPGGEDTHTAVSGMKEFAEDLNLRFFPGDEVVLKIRRGDNFLLKKLKMANQPAGENG